MSVTTAGDPSSAGAGILAGPVGPAAAWAPAPGRCAAVRTTSVASGAILSPGFPIETCLPNRRTDVVRANDARPRTTGRDVYRRPPSRSTAVLLGDPYGPEEVIGSPNACSTSRVSANDPCAAELDTAPAIRLPATVPKKAPSPGSSKCTPTPVTRTRSRAKELLPTRSRPVHLALA